MGNQVQLRYQGNYMKLSQQLGYAFVRNTGFEIQLAVAPVRIHGNQKHHLWV